MENNNAMLSIMFEEIKHLLCDLSEKIENLSTKRISPSESDTARSLSDAKTLILSKLEQIEQAQTAPPVIQKHKHIHVLDVQSTGMLCFLGLMVAAMVLVIVWNINLRDENWTMKDNDLKYRYVLSLGSITTNKLDELEYIFDTPQDDRRIEEIAHHVKDFEDKVRKLNRELEQLQQHNKKSADIISDVNTIQKQYHIRRQKPKVKNSIFKTIKKFI